MDYPCVEHLARFIYRAQAKCQLNLGLGKPRVGRVGTPNLPCLNPKFQYQYLTILCTPLDSVTAMLSRQSDPQAIRTLSDSMF